MTENRSIPVTRVHSTVVSDWSVVLCVCRPCAHRWSQNPTLWTKSWSEAEVGEGSVLCYGAKPRRRIKLLRSCEWIDVGLGFYQSNARGRLLLISGTFFSENNLRLGSTEKAGNMVVNTIHWFRKGLRLHDNPSLRDSIRGADTLRCIYILDPWFAGSSNVGINRWR